MEADKEKLIFVLLGPSGTGKTSLGKEARRNSQNEVMFLSTGEKLRKKQLLNPWEEPNMKTVKEACHKMISETLQAFKASPSHKILILDCVKDLDDAEYLNSQVKAYGMNITRALLMNEISGPEHLKQRWIQRGEERDLLRGSVTHYLNNWFKKFNDVMNYYKRIGVLSLHTTRDSPTRLTSWVGMKSSWFGPQYSRRYGYIVPTEFPLVSCPNNIRFLLIDSVEGEKIHTVLLSLLDVTRFNFALPASFVHCDRDVTWVADAARYHVTSKADGVRFLLIKVLDETYLINRKHEIYPCHIKDVVLPNDTVLDGEFLPSNSVSDIHPKITRLLESNVFLIFDVLAVSGIVVWKWPFSERKEALSQLSISKNIAAVVKLATACDPSRPERESTASPRKTHPTKKLSINVAIKEHYPSTSEMISFCLSSASNGVYPCDGLVFTPDTPYTFGPDSMLFKWQPPHSIHCDISYDDLDSQKRPCVYHHSFLCYLPGTKGADPEYLLSSGIVECQWNEEENAWDPLFLRRDKAVPNSDETIDHIQRICQRPYTENLLVDQLTRMTAVETSKENKTENKAHVADHPAMKYSFDELYSLINELVELNEVEKTIDSSTNLEIFNYLISSSPLNPIVCLCRGLVLHPRTKTIVTKPFVRFFEDVEDHNAQEMVEATVKFDGSLGIAFLWDGKVKVTTRRRMDSEQAVWALQWIEDHCNTTSFQQGYTYLFEIVYSVNTVIVNYPFQGLVLLAVTDNNGCELPYDGLLRCGRAIGFFMVTPRITGSYSEISWYCGGISSANESVSPTTSPFISGAMTSTSRQQEGWVVKFSDGSRQKIVHSWWKDVSKVTLLVHPQIVWLLVKHHRIRDVFGHLPNHFQKEILSMMKAIARQFLKVLKQVNQCPTDNSISKANFRLGYGNYRVMNMDGSSESEESEQELANEESFCIRELFEHLDLEEDGGHQNEEDDVHDSDANATDVDQRVRSENDANNSEKSDLNLFELARELQPYRPELKESLEKPSTSKICYGAMNLSPFYIEGKCNDLRLPVLEFIRPTGPAIEGYEPGANCMQTWGKGWKTLPNDERRLIQEVLQENHRIPPFLQMPVEVILLVLDFLDGSSLAKLCEVCWLLRQIVQSRKSLMKKIDEARLEFEELEATAWSFSSYRYSPVFGDGYGSDFY